MFGIFTNLKLLSVIGALSGLLLLSGVFFHYQKQQISTQRELIDELRNDRLVYEAVVTDIEYQQGRISKTNSLIESEQKTIDEYFSKMTGGLGNEFKNHVWDQKNIPAPIFCFIVCMREDSSTCDCTVTQHDTA